MLSIKEFPRKKENVIHGNRRFSRKTHRPRYCGREETECRTDRSTGSFPKSIRRAATEFIGRKKHWSIFLSYSDPSSEKLQTDFNTLCKQWRDDTFFQSSVSEICFHPAYQTIMAMGREALPLILDDLKRQGGHWFYALKSIARKDVAEGATSFEDARQRWLAWGKEQRYYR